MGGQTAGIIMEGDVCVRVRGPVERFSGECWEDVTFSIDMDITLLGDLNGWTYAVVDESPIRFIRLNPAVKVTTQEPVLL